MAAIMPRDLLSDSLLERLGGPADQAGDPTSLLAGDIAVLAEIGYLNVALPPEFGGLGCTLRQAACGQRRLAGHAPLTALAISAHLYWTGAAADAYRAGDNSVRWILVEAAGGALFAGGHGGTSGEAGEAGGDLRFADPRSRCEPSGENGYQFRASGVLTSVTPAWDWIAVHAVHQAARPQTVVAFAGRGTRCTPAFRVARVQPVGTPADVFATSALTWGHSLLASVEYSDARRAFSAAITEYAEAAASAVLAGEAGDAVRSVSPPRAAAGHPVGRWPIAEAGTRLDAMKARIAEITHPWQLVQEPTPDLGGQHLIGLYAMRHEVAESAASVHGLVEQLTGTQRRKSHPVS